MVSIVSEEQALERYLVDQVLGVSEVMHARYMQSLLLRAREELFRLSESDCGAEVPEAVSTSLTWSEEEDSATWFTNVLDVVDAYRTLDRASRNAMPRDLGDSLLRLHAALQIGGVQ